MKEIIIFKEKHGDRYFDASTKGLRNAACLKILEERFNSFYYDYDRNPPSDKNILSEEQITQLPTENLRNQEARKRRGYIQMLRDHKEEVEFYQRAKLAIETKDGKEAYQLLLERDGGEYEGFEIETLEETTEE